MSLGLPYLVSSLQGPPGHLVGSVAQEMDELASVNALGGFLSGFGELEKTHHLGADLNAPSLSFSPTFTCHTCFYPNKDHSWFFGFCLRLCDFVLSQNRD